MLMIHLFCMLQQQHLFLGTSLLGHAALNTAMLDVCGLDIEHIAIGTYHLCFLSIHQLLFAAAASW